ncbi:DUF4424 domain-containing protein [Rhodoplanes sp. TEM]|uniref:DUF4424 domain-containing protein n=1 Tax=Rhodoplanes tepidamans TaxID=200616 RepID=A0ABT5J5C9_RHOTP|nr:MULTISPECIES: DUF4424 domain-containing protein [Rhodoplanes]MDC7784858.1 DUF4424 domain-containing protein [Rhodoplanes tepidamans]MDC7986044.1 DUF4424 domain-containing protein [Rhodoplanes sp. TEM]MDQ0353915.1 hypothetical protein [Rhodoplanes tepidamans]
MRTTVLTIAAACAVALAAPVRANDSTAELATGGLVFVKNDAVEMTSEDLFVSAAEIRVLYRFTNTADRDVTVHVAFPMPEIKVDGPDWNVAVPTEDPVNLLGFVTTVNGKPVTTAVEQRVTGPDGVDRTALLQGLGVPLAPHLRSTGDALDRLPPARWDELVTLGLAYVDEYDAGKGMERHLAPRWSLKTTFYWQQTFPARAETVIAHRYQPSVGLSVQTSLGAPSMAREPEVAEQVKTYCVERDLMATLDRARKAAGSDFGPPYSEQRIDYVLTTGANWSGPIRDFRLVVDKGDPDSLVSFCGTGVKKIGPTTFEMRKTDFTPSGDLAVLILKRIRPEP